jgi:CRISPR system Cascade subunit CasC
VFGKTLGELRSQRSRYFGELIRKSLLDNSIPEPRAFEIAKQVVVAFSDIDTKKTKSQNDKIITTTACFASQQEITRAKNLASDIAINKRGDLAKGEAAQLILCELDGHVDAALFGRMLTNQMDGDKVVQHRQSSSAEAAIAVSHAITTHRVTIEDDFFSAVEELGDDLNLDQTGAAHVDEAGFASGVFYLYIVVDRRLLLENLGGDHDLAKKAIAALVEAAATVGPRGKIASFASFARTSYMLAERGDATPRTLASAFVEPVDRIQPRPNNLLTKSIKVLTGTRARFAHAYPDDVTETAEMNLADGKGTLTDMIRFAVEGL